MSAMRKEALLVAAIDELFSSSSDSEDDMLIDLIQKQCGEERPKVDRFVERVVRRLDDTGFRKHFRVSRSVCYRLIADYENSSFYPKHHGGPHPQKSAEEHVLSFLWFAGNKTTERAVAVMFGMAESTVNGIIERVAGYLDSISADVMRFPDTPEKKRAASAKFEEISGFPNVLGCIDGTYIETRCSAGKIASTYTNRHDKKSYGVQAICTADRKFVDVFLGPTGKMHDAETFKRSFALDKLPGVCEGKYHLLGDAAYPLREYLLTPFRDYGSLTPECVQYNLRLSQTRVRIENAFGLLKGRFRQLLYLEFWTVKKATLFILACCVLHNMCIEGGDNGLDYEDVGTTNASRPNPIEMLTFVDSKTEKVLKQLGEKKRKQIVRYLQTIQ
ncbi:hypothetical protein HPB49_007770 [Dermacentor silvarum]|uniref:Uncharacterized protein n=1 Tax=Dermacentor silvarum TaxID=543639 RepID=A0ACB8DWU4_DERSI|nr:uncharacterized protein LOC119437754 [Dermacentor silvarum]KAH7979009.1 hypothetical protein HPB49_007770 [Dermacentor silvarum]